VADPATKPRAFYAAVKALMGMSRINLAAVDAAIRARQSEELADQVAELERRGAVREERDWELDEPEGPARPAR
jgi:hypothetical protein